MLIRHPHYLDVAIATHDLKIMEALVVEDNKEREKFEADLADVKPRDMNTLYDVS